MKSILVTGASGYLGNLICSGLLAQGHTRLILPVRNPHNRSSMLQALTRELHQLGHDLNNLKEIDIEIIDFPPVGKISELAPLMEKHRVEQIIHSAGSLDYFNSKELQEVNVDLTSELVALADKLKLERFIHISTAFCSGFIKGLVRETLHGEPDLDPTEYTSSKRKAEQAVAAGQTSYLVVRPAVVIGDSKTGRYSGKQFGLYQLWSAADRFLSDCYREDFYAVAPPSKLQIIHQDAFMAAFLALFHNQPESGFIHIVSREVTLPTVRDIFTLWTRTYIRPWRLIYLNSFDEAPEGKIDKRLQMLMEFAAVNFEIASHTWKFECTGLEKLRLLSEIDFQDATIDTVERCQSYYLGRTNRMESYHQKYRSLLASHTTVIEPQPPASELRVKRAAK